MVAAILSVVAFAAQAAWSGAPDDLYGSYFAVHRALVAQSASAAAGAAEVLAEQARDGHQIEIAMRAETVAHASDLEQAREAFAALSDAMLMYRDGRGDRQPVVAWCKMVRRSWLQPDGPISNPYLGPSMINCGEIRSR